MQDFELDTDAFDVCLDALDQQFDMLTEEAIRLAESFLAVGEETKGLIPILITVSKDKRSRSTTIRWSKVKPAGPRSSKRLFISPITKGRNTDRYNPAVFRFLKPEIRSRVLLYEEMLSSIRYSLARNREASRHLMNTRVGMQKRMKQMREVGLGEQASGLGFSDASL